MDSGLPGRRCTPSTLDRPWALRLADLASAGRWQDKRTM